jgi:hypothetical protein
MNAQLKPKTEETPLDRLRVHQLKMKAISDEIGKLQEHRRGLFEAASLPKPELNHMREALLLAIAANDARLAEPLRQDLQSGIALGKSIDSAKCELESVGAEISKLQGAMEPLADALKPLQYAVLKSEALDRAELCKQLFNELVEAHAEAVAWGEQAARFGPDLVPQFAKINATFDCACPVQFFTPNSRFFKRLNFPDFHEARVRAAGEARSLIDGGPSGAAEKGQQRAA